MKNARFWLYWNGGWVKMTMRPGHTLRTESGGETDEGYACQAHQFEYDADEGIVLSDCVHWGRDCDGPYEYRGEWVCPVDKLAALPAEVDEYGDRPARPAWQEKSTYQRDVHAEMDGY